MTLFIACDLRAAPCRLLLSSPPQLITLPAFVSLSRTGPAPPRLAASPHPVIVMRIGRTHTSSPALVVPPSVELSALFLTSGIRWSCGSHTGETKTAKGTLTAAAEKAFIPSVRLHMFAPLAAEGPAGNVGDDVAS
ncbi:hypothetical protein PAMA_000101 [Pampus argenteus]